MQRRQCMHMVKLFAAVALSIATLTSLVRAAERGNCGEYMYWKDGKCVDARNKDVEPWPERMAKKKATW